jgi:ankyrin repeat protein
LEVLRDSLPSSVRRTLSELPESLDETYERILKEIKKPNRVLAVRVLQCLAVATRPLRVAELAEVLAVDFDDAEGIPRLNSDWRWEDQEQALLIACSSLIAIVEAGDVKASDSDSDVEANDSASEVGAGYSHSEAETDDGDSYAGVGDSRIVQFSHFSVKEFLTSSRLATASGEVSSYHIDLEPAHTILGQACLGVLLQTQDDVEGHTPEDHPLARYAAEHWTTHAQFGEVSSRLQKGMEYLFDPGKPHFKVWLTIYDIDILDNESTFRLFAQGNKSPAVPLYYAALCGFHNLVKHLMAKYPRDVNADGGHYVSPLVAALAGEHFQTADLLRLNGADPNVQGVYNHTPLHYAVDCDFDCGNIKVALKLIECGADINAKNAFGSTPLHWAARDYHFEDGTVLRLLLEHGGDINARDTRGFTPLHEALHWGGPGVVSLLLKHGADVEAGDINGETPFQAAAEKGHDEVVKLLLKHGADVEAKDNYGRTALELAAKGGHDEVVKLLLKHGADAEAKNRYGNTALQVAALGHDKVVKLLLKHGADAEAKDRYSNTALQAAALEGYDEVVKLLLKHGADAEAKNRYGKTALQVVVEGHDKVVKLLLKHGADVEAKNSHGKTALEVAAKGGHGEVVKLLREHGTK